MKEPVRNVAPSIQARLKNESERQGRPFAEILQYYVMERFLFRLARTKYATKFVLKGQTNPVQHIISKYPFPHKPRA